MNKLAASALVLSTAMSIVLQFIGYDILETLVFVISMDMLAVWMSTEGRRKSQDLSMEQIKSLEMLCASMSRNIRRLDMNKDMPGSDIISTLRAINEKNIALERKIGSFGQHLIKSNEDGRIFEN